MMIKNSKIHSSLLLQELNEKWWTTSLILMLGGPLVPSLGSGLSNYELLALTATLLGLIIAWVKTESPRYYPQQIKFSIVVMVFSMFGLFNMELYDFANREFGLILFFATLIIGTRVSETQSQRLTIILLLCTLAGVSRDYYLDSMGWVQGIGKLDALAWEVGKRGLLSSQSVYGLVLIVLSIPYIFATISPYKRFTYAAFVLLGLWHIVVVGQGRGLTLIALLTIFLNLVKTARQQFFTILVVLSLGSLILGGIVPYLQDSPYLEGITNRFSQIEKAEDVDRLRQAQYAISILSEASITQWLTGFEQSILVEGFEGVHIHNGYLDIILRYGIIAGFAYFMFWLLATLKALRLLLIRINMFDYLSRSCALMVVNLFIFQFVGTLFVNWRGTTILGLMVGVCLIANVKRNVTGVQQRLVPINKRY
jgi:hypothetical protein